jgi:multiple sugar transport system substrate-binding protein
MSTITKRVYFMLLVFVLSVSLAACNSGSSGNSAGETPPSAGENPPSGEAAPSSDKSNTAKKDEPKKKPVTIRVGVLNSPGEKENAEAVAEVFKKTHPHVTVKIEPYVGDFRTKALAQAASGDLPDVTWIYDGGIKEFAEAGILEPLDDYLKANNVNIADIYPGMLGLGLLNGKQYAIPRDYNHIVFYTNVTLLKQEGLSLPENGWDWNTFMDYAKKLTKKDASGKTIQYAVRINPTWEPVWVACSQGRGGHFLENMKVNLTDPKVVHGLKDCWDLVKDGYSIDPYGRYPEEMFSAGKVAFSVSVKPVAQGVHDSATSKGWEWDVTTFPKLPEKHAVGGGMSGYAVYSKSKHKEEAAAFLSLFVKREGQEAFGKTGNSVPVLMSMANDQTWRNNPVPGKNMDAFVAFPEADVLRIHEVKLPVKASAELNSGIRGAFQKYIQGKSSLEDALKVVEEKVNAMLK